MKKIFNKYFKTFLSMDIITFVDMKKERIKEIKKNLTNKTTKIDIERVIR